MRPVTNAQLRRDEARPAAGGAAYPSADARGRARGSPGVGAEMWIGCSTVRPRTAIVARVIAAVRGHPVLSTASVRRAGQDRRRRRAAPSLLETQPVRSGSSTSTAGDIECGTTSPPECAVRMRQGELPLDASGGRSALSCYG